LVIEVRRTQDLPRIESRYKDLGEEKIITLKAFVFIARQEGAESVNCGRMSR